MFVQSFSRPFFRWSLTTGLEVYVVSLLGSNILALPVFTSMGWALGSVSHSTYSWAVAFTLNSNVNAPFGPTSNPFP